MFTLSLIVLICFINVFGYIVSLYLYLISKYEIESKFPKFKRIIRYYEKTTLFFILYTLFFILYSLFFILYSLFFILYYYGSFNRFNILAFYYYYEFNTMWCNLFKNKNKIKTRYI
jgi:hypothetical protein